MQYKLLLLSLIFNLQLFSQNDTIRLNNNDVLVGSVENFSTGVLEFKTSYSDEDFKIEFDKITEIYIHQKVIVTLTKSRRRYGYVRPLKPGIITIKTNNHLVETFKIEEIIAFQEIKEDRRKRISASIDIGYDFTKAQNKRQGTVNGTMDYVGEFWVTNASLNILESRQKNVEDISRIDGKANLRRLLRKNWYLIGEFNYLSNTEQALDARYTPNIGFGKLLVSTPKLYLGLSSGFAFNFETYFTTNTPNKQSTEAFLSSSLNIYNIEDFDLTTDLRISPTVSNFGRVRLDYNLNLKYDLPYDFYIKTSFTLNYDSKPAVTGNQYDYIFSSGFGWEFNK